MANFNPNVVHAGPTSPRERLKTVVIKQVNNTPPASYVENGQAVAQLPEREGQIRFVYTNPDTYEGILYVVVDIGGTLYWVPAATRTTYIDKITSEEWDSNAQYYHTYYTNRS